MDVAVYDNNGGTDVIRLQEEFLDLFGHESATIYDCYTTKTILKCKIDLIMSHLKEQERSHLASIMWDQRIYAGQKHLFMSTIIVICVYDSDIAIGPFYEQPPALYSKKFSIHPVFRIQKCVPAEWCTEPCSIFVDENARVYQNWNDYQVFNELEESLVLAPKNGIYKKSHRFSVSLDIFNVLNAFGKIDAAATTLGIASAGITATALIPAVTIAPIILTGAAFFGIASTVYCTLRSVGHLLDRKIHQQSIDFDNRDAQSAWFNVAAGSLALTASAANKKLRNTAVSGRNISRAMQYTAYTINSCAV